MTEQSGDLTGLTEVAPGVMALAPRTLTEHTDDHAEEHEPALLEVSDLTVDFTAGDGLDAYGFIGGSANAAVIEDGGATLRLVEDSWKKLALPTDFEITADTVLRFTAELVGGIEGKLHAIGLDQDNSILNEGTALFQFAGSFDFAPVQLDYAGGAVTYEVPLGEFAGQDFNVLTIVNGDSGGKGAEMVISDVIFLGGGETSSNTAPTTAPIDVGAVLESDAAVDIDLLAGAVDAEGDALTVTDVVVTDGDGAAVAFTLNGALLTVDPAQFADDLATGDQADVTVSYNIDDGNGGVVANVATLAVLGEGEPPPPPEGLEIDFTAGDGLEAYGFTGGSADAAVIEDGGSTLRLVENSWKKLALPEDFEITADTVLRFTAELVGGIEGKLHAIGLDQDNSILNEGTALFQFAGSFDFAPVQLDYAGGAVTYEIPLGEFAGQDFNVLTIVNGDSGGKGAEMVISDVIFLGGETSSNTAPTTAPIDVGAVLESDAAVDIDLLAGAVDAEGDALTVTDVVVTDGDGVAVAFTLNGALLTVDPAQFADDLATGDQADVTVSYNIDDGNGGVVANTATLAVLGEGEPPPPPEGLEIDFTAGDGLDAYGFIGGSANAAVIEDGGATLRLVEDSWKKLALPTDFEITADTVLRFTAELVGGIEGKLHAIGLDQDNSILNEGTALFQFAGSFDFAPVQLDYAGGAVTYEIPLGEFAGQDFNFLTIVNGDSGGKGAEMVISDVIFLGGETSSNTAPTTAPIDVGAVLESDAAVDIDLLAGAVDAEGDALTVTDVVVTDGAGAAVAFTLNGALLTIDPAQFADELVRGDQADVTVSYNIDDGNGGVVANVATLAVLGVNTAPTAAPIDAGAVAESAAAVDIDLLAGADDADGDVLGVADVVVTDGAGAAVDFALDGALLTIDPAQFADDLGAGDQAQITVDYTILDGNGGEIDNTATLLVDGEDAIPDLFFSGQDTPDGYNIEVAFSGDWTDEFKAAFVDASELISDIITEDVPDIFFDGHLFDDVRIAASLVEIDGVGSILGQAGPTLIRSGSLLPIDGIMQFDIADAANMLSNGTWGDVIFHEMMHAIGFGGLWGDGFMNLVTDVGGDLRFTGENAIAAYFDEFEAIALADGLATTGVPVETDGGPGTAGAHWDEATFGAEIMTGFAQSGMFLSGMSIAALEDMGYETIFDLGALVA